jgi:cobalt-zinc-cadmium efflux system membrane fusion protein
VPGRLDYDARSRIDYDSPVDGIVARISVEIRQKVSRGDSLAEISSTEVGVARDEVKKREDDREIARKAADWAATVSDNVQSLLGMLEGHPPLEGVEREFAGRILGDYREKILGAYSKLLYVEKVDVGTRALGDASVLSGRIVEERTSNLEIARASFTAACENAKFDTLQERGKAKAALEQCERLLQVSKENLRNLVGSRLDARTPDAADGGDDSSENDSISAISLRTPFDGIVEEIFVSRGERVMGGDLSSPTPAGSGSGPRCTKSSGRRSKSPRGRWLGCLCRVPRSTAPLRRSTTSAPPSMHRAAACRSSPTSRTTMPITSRECSSGSNYPRVRSATWLPYLPPP